MWVMSGAQKNTKYLNLGGRGGSGSPPIFWTPSTKALGRGFLDLQNNASVCAKKRVQLLDITRAQPVIHAPNMREMVIILAVMVETIRKQKRLCLSINDGQIKHKSTWFQRFSLKFIPKLQPPIVAISNAIWNQICLGILQPDLVDLERLGLNFHRMPQKRWGWRTLEECFLMSNCLDSVGLRPSWTWLKLGTSLSETWTKNSDYISH